jgi:hypothetical protein
MTDTHEPRKPEQWTYSVGHYNSFLYWHSFEEACNAAFANSPDVTAAHVFTPNGPGLDVTREQWASTTEEQWAEVRKP